MLRLMRAEPAVPQEEGVRSDHYRLSAWLAIVPNLARGLEPTGLDQLWMADITYLRLLEEFAFLAIVLDAFSRRIVGWTFELHLQASLAVAALSMALAERRPAYGSRAGNLYDNAQAESFIKTLEHEEVDNSDCRDLRTARRQIGDFIEQV
jgi:transposase InsO family protein